MSKWSYGFIKKDGEDMFVCKSSEIDEHILYDQNCRCNPTVYPMPAHDRLGYMVRHKEIKYEL
jgi:hypothetical protein